MDVRLIVLDKITQNNSKGFSLFGYVNCLARKRQLDIHIDAMAENMWIMGSELWKWRMNQNSQTKFEFISDFNTEEKYLIMKLSVKNIHGNIISGNKGPQCSFSI